jgi:hypothetical protein
MATAQVTIVTALQALRVLGEGQSPTTARNEYCLRQLNSYLRQLAGFGGSLPFINERVSSAYQIGTRYPCVRLMCVAGVTLTVPERPIDGQRIEIVDASETADTSNITVARNGWLINGAASDYVISTEAANVKLMFRADVGDWKLVDDLALGDQLPFPADFDEAIALNLARRLTLYGQRLAPEDADLADKGAKRIRARYAKPPAAQFDSAVSNIGGSSGNVVSLNDFLQGNF